MQSLQEAKRALRVARAEVRDGIRKLEVEADRIDKAIVLLDVEAETAKPAAEPKPAKAKKGNGKTGRVNKPRVDTREDMEKVLHILRTEGPQRRLVLRNALGVTDQRMTAVIDRLIRGKLIGHNGQLRGRVYHAISAAPAQPQSVPAYQLPGYRPAAPQPEPAGVNGTGDQEAVVPGSGFGQSV